MKLTGLERREARAFIEDELRAEQDARRRRLLELVLKAMDSTNAGAQQPPLPEGQ